MSRLRRMPGAVLLIVLLLVGVTTAAAALGRATSRLGGGTVTALKVARGTEFRTESKQWIDLPGASQTITVPAGQSALVVARFSAATDCTTTDPDFDTCKVRVLVGGQPAGPSLESAFDTDEANDGIEAHSIDRSRVVTAGTYTVKVQLAGPRSPDEAPIRFSLTDWQLTVEQARI